MRLLAQQIPSFGEILRCNPVNPDPAACPDYLQAVRVPLIPGAPLPPTFHNLGDFLSGMLNIAFSVAVFLAFFWMIWGAFHYIFAGGDKEGLRKARSRIIWALIGLVLVALAYAIAQFAEQILTPQRRSPLSLVTPAHATPIIPTLPVVDIGRTYGYGNIPNFGEGVSRLVTPAFSIAIVAVTLYLVFAGVKFLTSGGDKEGIAKARAMITHAIIGVLILMFIFLAFQFITQFFGFRFNLTF